MNDQICSTLSKKKQESSAALSGLQAHGPWPSRRSTIDNISWVSRWR